MRIRRLHLMAFGPFSGRVLDFGAQAHGLVLVQGPNEAGKSSLLRAISDLRFGIPVHSADDFVHPYAQMRIGAELIDEAGQLHTVLRRKGRQATLLLAHATAQGLEPDTPAPLALETQLTAGLTREAYEAMFGLDHRRLREGGQALLQGQGDIGAALFEASAGVRSLPRVLAALDEQARSFFMPGARGRRAPINEALHRFETHQAAWRQALLRPAQWTQCQRRHAQAQEALAQQEALWRQAHARLLLIRELRAVAPLIGTLDHAEAALRELADAPTLATTASADMAVALESLQRAQRQAGLARDEAARQQAILEAVAPDPRALAVEAAVRRLVGQAESIEAHQSELDQARRQVQAAHDEAVARAHAIAPQLAPPAVRSLRPSEAARVAIEDRLTALENAVQALAQHRALVVSAPGAGLRPARPPRGSSKLGTARRLLVRAAEQEASIDALPPKPAREALHAARRAVARAEPALQRLEALPAEIQSTQVRLQRLVATLGLPDDAALLAARPLLDSEIDEALEAQRVAAARLADLQRRLDQIEAARRDLAARLDQLTQSGPVPTRDEVLAARAQRDERWAALRRTAFEQRDLAAALPLAPEVEAAMQQADRLADAHAQDADRAAQLQSARREREQLARDSLALAQDQDQLRAAEAAREAAWQARLSGAGLPALPPARLRDWQVHLAQARQVHEQGSTLAEEAARRRAEAQALRAGLRAAIDGIGGAAFASDAALPLLIAHADEIAQTLDAKEKHALAQQAQAREREIWTTQHAQQGTALMQDLSTADAALADDRQRLHLPADAAAGVIRARLRELDALAQAHERLGQAQGQCERAEGALQRLQQACASVWQAIGETPPADLRLAIEALALRVEHARQEQVRRDQARAAREQALAAQQSHEREAQGHRTTLASLCEAAGVPRHEDLPGAIERSRRRAQAQALHDHTRVQLAQASTRSVDELRSLLQARDGATLEADEAALGVQAAALEQQWKQARQEEEAARRELEALDSADTAAREREAMEQAGASVRAHMAPWIRTRLAHGLLEQAQRRFRERAQGPMLQAATRHFHGMTQGAFTELVPDDSGPAPVLLARRAGGQLLPVQALSEGTRDQLYLALRLAALEIRRAAGTNLPVVLDDILMTSDDGRAAAMLQALAAFAREGQVLVFTHHRHLMDVAAAALGPADLQMLDLGSP